MLKSTLAYIINYTIGYAQKANTSNLTKTKGLTEININDFNKKNTYYILFCLQNSLGKITLTQNGSIYFRF